MYFHCTISPRLLLYQLSYRSKYPRLKTTPWVADPIPQLLVGKMKMNVTNKWLVRVKGLEPLDL